MSLRRLLQFRWPTMLVAVAVLSVLLVANTRPSKPVSLGHISSDEPPMRPGLWVMGYEYGWPWTWRRESFKDGVFNVTVFDRVEWQGLFGNVAVGVLILAAAMVSTELVLWSVARWQNPSPSGRGWPKAG